MDFGIEQGFVKNKRNYKKSTKVIFFILLLFCLFAVLIILRVQYKYNDKIKRPEDLSPPNIGLVFGAGLKARGVPGVVLQDRVLTAIKLFQDGRVGMFVMSGDNSTAGHNEVQAMENFAIDNGLSREVLLFDHAGLSTLDSCQNIKDDFGLSEVVLITQKYHLHRALYICNEIGLNAVGISAQDTGYGSQWKFSVREWGASLQAWFKLLFN